MLKQLSTRPLKRGGGVDRGDADDEEDGEGEYVLVGDGERENIRLNTICVRDSIRVGPRWGLGLGRMMVRVTTMSAGWYTSIGGGEVEHVSVRDGRDPSKSGPFLSTGSNTTVWFGHASLALVFSVLMQGSCLIIKFELPVLKSEMSL